MEDRLNVINSEPKGTPASPKPVEVNFEYTERLPDVLRRLGISILVSTYQAGRLISIGTNNDTLQVGFAHFKHAMGVTRTPSGIALGSRNEIWQLAASREIALGLKPKHTHDIAFLARTAHVTGPIKVHDICWCKDKIYAVNTAFNCISRIEHPHSFDPIWKPSFISEIAPGDKCHLNGMAVSEDARKISYATALGLTNEMQGWREKKKDGGILIDVSSNQIVASNLCMPHSPRVHNKQLYFLNSGKGDLSRCEPTTGNIEMIAKLSGFTRGLDFYKDYAFIGLSKIRESKVFGGLPIEEIHQELRSGLAIVDCNSGRTVGSFYFQSEIHEIFAVTVVPGHLNPFLLGPYPEIDRKGTVWMLGFNHAG